MKSKSSTMQLAYHWRALSAHMASIIQVTFTLEIVAGMGMALRDVVSRISSGAQAATSGRRAGERRAMWVLLCCADLKRTYHSWQCQWGAYRCPPPPSTNPPSLPRSWQLYWLIWSRSYQQKSALGVMCLDLRNRYSKFFIGRSSFSLPKGVEALRVAQDSYLR